MARTRTVALLAAIFAQGSAAPVVEVTDAVLDEALRSNDECAAGDATCALSALQLRGVAVSAGKEPDDEDDGATSTNEAPEEPEETGKTAATQAPSLLESESNHSVWASFGLAAPSHVAQYEGIAFPPMSVIDNGRGETHVFAVGDWGSVGNTHYTAPHKRPSGHNGKKCPQDCGYVHGIDDKAQLLVADQMRARAAKNPPQYFFNVGDNFYWAGISQNCGSMRPTSLGHSMFASTWQEVYGSLTNKPWLSCLGNHDYGGWQFNAGWDQQIGYTFLNQNWVMPARYYSRVMNHPGFTVEVFVLDSNAHDVSHKDEDGEHNICGAKHNPPGASCGSVGGPANLDACYNWFWDSHRKQQQWLEKKLQESKANWQIAVTHFPCGHENGWYSNLHQNFGLDLLVTGHRHDQELWANANSLGGLTCFVTGGGGGITSEAPPNGHETNQYGFFDLTISAAEIKIESINLHGKVIASHTIQPKEKR